MPNKHTSSPERMMLTTITDVIGTAQGCRYVGTCPLMSKLFKIKKSLQTEVKNMGNDDRDQRP